MIHWFLSLEQDKEQKLGNLRVEWERKTISYEEEQNLRQQIGQKENQHQQEERRGSQNMMFSNSKKKLVLWCLSMISNSLHQGQFHDLDFDPHSIFGLVL